MKLNSLVVITFALMILLLSAGCGDSENDRITALSDKIAFRYNAELNITRVKGEGLLLDTVQMYDLSKRVSEGNRIIGVRIWDKDIKFEVIGAENWEFTEGKDYKDIELGTDQEFLDNQSGRFRIRLSEEKPLIGESSGIFRKKFTFTPTKLGVLVEEDPTGGFEEIQKTEPDIGSVKLEIPSIFGSKQPSGGTASRDGRSLIYTYPGDMTVLQPMTFTYFPTRGGFYFGSVLMWILTRIAWMVLGVVLYLWWIKQREKAKLEKKMRKAKPPKEKALPLPRPMPEDDRK